MTVSTGLDRLRVMIVDDNANMRTILAAVLEGLGVREIRESGHGEEALAALRDWPADVVVVDYKMRPMDGVVFTRRLRTADDSPNPYLPVIMLTGHAERSRVFEARDAGVSEFIVKPMTTRALIDRLESVLSRPRPFVRSADYFGPDRRRRDDPDHPGPRRRRGDGGETAGVPP